MKVLLVLVDGMRPDSLGEIPYVEEIKQRSSYTLHATTVYPSDTLPCHMSLFHSVDPDRHGTLSNTYAPPENPVPGLFETLRKQKMRSGMFYSWEQLRDVARPGNLNHAYFISCGQYPGETYVPACTDAALDYIQAQDPDFVFLYLAMPDDVGHKKGWMGEEYLASVKLCWENIERIVSRLPEDYTVIITADHGGHDRGHGTYDPQDMTIPMFFMGEDFAPGKVLSNVNIKDIVPTILSLLQVEAPADWEGKSLL